MPRVVGALSYLIVTSAPCDRDSDYPHSAEGKTEAQRQLSTREGRCQPLSCAQSWAHGERSEDGGAVSYCHPPASVRGKRRSKLPKGEAITCRIPVYVQTYMYARLGVCAFIHGCPERMQPRSALVTLTMAELFPDSLRVYHKTHTHCAAAFYFIFGGGSLIRHLQCFFIFPILQPYPTPAP